MRPEETFVKQLQTYLDTNFNEYSKNRIFSYLKEFRESIPLIYIKEEAPASRQDIIREPIREPRRRLIKNHVTKDELIVDAIEICGIHGIDLSDFLDTKYYKGRNNIISIRKKFCIMVHEKYVCNNTVLAEFFNVHHSTISHYLYGKRYILNANKKRNEKIN
jgi:hypothetical protein